MKCILTSVIVFIFLFSLSSSYSKGGRYTINQYLHIQGNYLPHFVCGDNAIIFSNGLTGTQQLWRMDIDGGYPQLITYFDEGVDFYSVHPWKDLMIIGVDTGGNERTQLYLANSWGRCLNRITFNDSAIYGFGGWARDSSFFVYESNERDERYFDIYLYELISGESRLIMQDDHYNESTGVSPDGRYVTFIRYYDSHNSDLFLIDLEDGNNIIKVTPHKGESLYGAPSWLSDSSGFYFSSNECLEYTGLCFYDMKKRKWKWAITPEWDIDGYGVSFSGRYLYWEENIDGYDRLYIKDLKSGNLISPPDMLSGLFNRVSFSIDEKMMLFDFTSPSRPNDVYIWNVGADDNPERLTYAVMGGISEEDLISPSLIHYISFDGLLIPFYLYLPEETREGKKVPVIVMIHGGPEGQERAWFNAITQFFVNKGFAFAVPNIRGSTGYGKKYSHMDDRYKRSNAVHDVECLAEWIKEQAWADSDRLVIMGGSYGGYMVLACLTEQPEIWACGVERAGIVNFITFLEKTGAWRISLRESEYGYLDKDRTMLEEISPINKADRIRAPLVVVQGANDPRVPREEAEQIVAKLRENGVPVLYLLYEDEGHGIVKLTNQIDSWTRTVKFMDEVLEYK
ncbi:MAG: S9 family peptidase [bacterium]